MNPRALLKASVIFLALAFCDSVQSQAQSLAETEQYLQIRNFTFNGNIVENLVAFKQWDPTRGRLLYWRLSFEREFLTGAFYIRNDGNEAISITSLLNEYQRKVWSTTCPVMTESATIQTSITNLSTTFPGGQLQAGGDGVCVIPTPVPVFVGDPVPFAWNWQEANECLIGTGVVSVLISSSFSVPGIDNLTTHLELGGLTTTGAAILEFYPEPRILKAERTPEGVAITWTNAPNAEVQRRQSLTEGSWEPIAWVFGGPELYVDTDPPPDGAFYRVAVPIPPPLPFSAP